MRPGETTSHVKICDASPLFPVNPTQRSKQPAGGKLVVWIIALDAALPTTAAGAVMPLSRAPTARQQE